MAQLIADRRDINFVLYEQLDVDSLKNTPRYQGQNRKMFDMVINEARNFGVKEVLPLNELGDREGVTLDKDGVRLPESFHRAWKLLREGEWISMTEDPEYGGQALPHVVAKAAAEYIVGADISFWILATLCHGAGKMVEVFGTDRQKELFLKKLYTGEWGGTMVLTEPDAGSDLGNLTTSARKNTDGTYSISGNKIFITDADQDLTENIIHPVLARIEGAPRGAGGISLFLVPKFRVSEDGGPGEHNDVVVTAIEEKMGLHGSPTCQVTFGGKGQCQGELLGEENKGMRVMFHMMNEARLGVGSVGMFQGSAAYLYALDYARQRVQGRDISQVMEKDAKPVPIIQHPDIRRMLLWMKAHVEGMRSFVYYTAHLFDLETCSENAEEKQRINGLIELLTPVLKAYNSDKGFDATVWAMQIYGGAGYTKDYPIERLCRDSKINSIFEGSNGIQAMDLLGRKLGMLGGAVFMGFIEEILKAVAKAQKTGLEDLAQEVETAANQLSQTALSLGKMAGSGGLRAAFGFAYPFQDVMGDLIMAWMLLWRATIARPALDAILDGLDKDARDAKIIKDKNAAFYMGQVKSAEYFIYSLLPATLGKMAAIRRGHAAVVNIPEASFGGL
ncbi:MAG: acyl-CoA dehydrogenase [Desulfatibacillum sp.]|nr:acyl-CoA dehydrogenase [Desulfatibacillum sp.]